MWPDRGAGAATLPRTSAERSGRAASICSTGCTSLRSSDSSLGSCRLLMTLLSYGKLCFSIYRSSSCTASTRKASCAARETRPSSTCSRRRRPAPAIPLALRRVLRLARGGRGVSPGDCGRRSLLSRDQCARRLWPPRGRRRGDLTAQLVAAPGARRRPHLACSRRPSEHPSA